MKLIRLFLLACFLLAFSHLMAGPNDGEPCGNTFNRQARLKSNPNEFYLMDSDICRGLVTDAWEIKADSKIVHEKDLEHYLIGIYRNQINRKRRGGPEAILVCCGDKFLYFNDLKDSEINDFGNLRRISLDRMEIWCDDPVILMDGASSVDESERVSLQDTRGRLLTLIPEPNKKAYRASLGGVTGILENRVAGWSEALQQEIVQVRSKLGLQDASIATMGLITGASICLVLHSLRKNKSKPL